MHEGMEMGATRICSTFRDEIREILEHDIQISLRELTSENDLAHDTVSDISRRELRIFRTSYK